MNSIPSALRRFFYACIFFLSAQSSAETYLNAGAWSHHIGDGNYNETHNLVAIETKSFIGGYFENSYKDDSFFLAYRWEAWRFRDIDFSALAGGVYGYSHCTKGDDGGSKTLCPMIAPAATYTRFKVQPSLLLMGNALALSVRWGL